jgi:hypothetical protein
MNYGEKIKIEKVLNGFLVIRQNEKIFISNDVELTHFVGLLVLKTDINWSLEQLYKGMFENRQGTTFLLPKDVLKIMEKKFQ